MTEDGGEKISRRSALKKGAKVLAGAVLVGCMPEKLVKEALKEEEPKYLDVGENFRLTLFVGNSSEAMEIYINSGLTLDRKPKLRMEGETYVAKKFEDGAETVRMLAEITDFSIYKVEINKDMVNDSRVNTFRSPTGPSLNSTAGLFPIDHQMWGIRVIVSNLNYFDGTDAPEEKNKNTNRTDPWMDVTGFGDGFLVGELKQINGKNVLDETSFVCDARALTITN